MSKSFNLLDEPWLPVQRSNGHTEALGLLDVFRHCDDITALAETTPPSLVAQYRLLLAIVHRALGRTLPDGGWSNRDRAHWWRAGLPQQAILDYLGHWRERFWLFHPEHPFMQVAALATTEQTMDKRKPWTQISLASASGNAPVIFDHAADELPTAVSPAVALSTLLGFLQFTPGGFVKTLRDSDKAGPLANTAAIVPVGDRLGQTLVLNLHAAPVQRLGEDAPCWEHAALTIRELTQDPTIATGPNDRYTRLTRAVLLLPEDGRVRWLRFAAGHALQEDDNAPDPMASYRAGSTGLVRLSFSEGKAIWRDLPALLPNTAGKSQPAAVLQQAIALHLELDPFEACHQPLLVAGIASDKAKLLRWRVERIVLPRALLDDADRTQMLRSLLEQGEALHGDLSRLAVDMLAAALPNPNSKDTRNRARDLIRNGPLAPTYFSGAERALPALLMLLGDSDFEQAEIRWHTALRRAAQDAWDQVLNNQGQSPRALRADAQCQPRFWRLLKQQLPMAEVPPHSQPSPQSTPQEA